MEKLRDDEIKKIVFLMKYDKSKTLEEQSVIGAPSGGIISNEPSNSQGKSYSFEELIKSWKEKYVTIAIPYPSKVYGDARFIVIPRGEIVTKNFTEYNQLRLRDVLPDITFSEYTNQNFTLHPLTVFEFTVPNTLEYKEACRGKKYITLWTVNSEKTLNFSGYYTTNDGKNYTSYNPSTCVEEMPVPVDYSTAHNWLVGIEIVSFLASLFANKGTAVRKTLFYISSLAGLSNAGLYFSEGKNFTGTIYLLFSIPGIVGALAREGMTVFGKYTAQEIGQVVSKIDNGAELTTKEYQIAKELSEQLGSKAAPAIVGKYLGSYILNETLRKVGLKAMLSKAALFGLISIPIFGVEYGIGEWWAAVNAKDINEIEENSVSRIIWRWLWGDEKTSDFPSEDKIEEIMNEVDKKLNDLKNQGVNTMETALTLDPERADTYADSTLNKIAEKNLKTKEEMQRPRVVPTYEQVYNGEIDPTNNEPFVFKYLDRGQGIKKLKRMLRSKGFQLEINDIYDYDLFDLVDEQLLTNDKVKSPWFIDEDTIKLLESSVIIKPK